MNAALGSLAAQAMTDAELAKKIRRGRAKADGDLRALELWARQGFSSSPVDGRGEPLLGQGQEQEKDA